MGRYGVGIGVCCIAALGRAAALGSVGMGYGGMAEWVGMGACGIVAFWRVVVPCAPSYGCIKVYNEQNDATSDVIPSELRINRLQSRPGN